MKILIQYYPSRAGWQIISRGPLLLVPAKLPVKGKMFHPEQACCLVVEGKDHSLRQPLSNYVHAILFCAHMDLKESKFFTSYLFLELERLKSKGSLREPITTTTIMLGNHVILFWYGRRPPAGCMMGDPKRMSGKGWTDWPTDVPVSGNQMWFLSAAGLPGV